MRARMMLVCNRRDVKKKDDETREWRICQELMIILVVRARISLPFAAAAQQAQLGGVRLHRVDDELDVLR